MSSPSDIAVHVRNADRMMTRAEANEEGIAVEFADGCRGAIPFADVPEIGNLRNLKSLDLPNPFELVLRNETGETVELPWDFARHYCDSSYQQRVEAVAAAGRSTMGTRIRKLRESAGLTQDALASEAGMGRVRVG